MSIDYVTVRLTRKQAKKAMDALSWYEGAVLDHSNLRVPVGIHEGFFIAARTMMDALMSGSEGEAAPARESEQA